MTIENNRAKVKIGDEFGRGTILELYYKWNGRQKHLWARCLCKCGNIFNCRVADLKNGATQSCGCLRKEIGSKKLTKHGYKDHPLYRTWKNIKQRCNNSSNKQYKYYGGRNIIISEEFHDPKIFIEYCLEIGWEPGLTIDRENNNGNYERGNLRAATNIIQANNKTNNSLFSYDGETMTLAQWSRDPRCKVSYHCLRDRINKLNWSFERALLTPLLRQKIDKENKNATT